MKQSELLDYSLYQNKIFFPRFRSKKTLVNKTWHFAFETYVRVELDGKQYLVWVCHRNISDTENSEVDWLKYFIAACYKVKILYKVDVDNIDNVISLYEDPDQRSEVEKLKDEINRFML